LITQYFRVEFAFEFEMKKNPMCLNQSDVRSYLLNRIAYCIQLTYYEETVSIT